MPAAQSKPSQNPINPKLADALINFCIEEVQRAVAPLFDQRSEAMDRLERRIDHLFETRSPSAAITDLALEYEDGHITVTASAANGETITRRIEVPAPTINPAGTWTDDHTYKRLDLVMKDGGSWLAVRDAPGPCPGDDWQLLAMRGKAGRRGASPTQADLRHLIAEAARDGN